MALPAPSDPMNHGNGWRGLLAMSRFLQRHADQRHTLQSIDPLTGRVDSIQLEGRAEVLDVAERLCHMAEQWRQREHDDK